MERELKETYQFDSRARYSETDEQGKLSLTGIINYLQDCSTPQSEDTGSGVQYLKDNHRVWWLSSWQIVIDRYPRLGEEIIISMWSYDFKGIYGYRSFTIQDKSGTYLVRANSVRFFFDTEAGRPVRVREENVWGYGSGEEKLTMDYASRRIEVSAEYETREPVVVARHHLDTNHHANNVQYVEIARESLPEPKVGEIQVEYKKAAVLGDVTTPHINRNGEGYTVSLCDKEGLPHVITWLREQKAGKENND